MKRQHGMKVRAALACVLALGALSAAADDPGETIYLGARPSVSGDGRTFVFEWADNIWIASTEGAEQDRAVISLEALEYDHINFTDTDSI